MSDTSSALSEIDSEQFNDLELGRDFPVTSPAETGSRDVHGRNVHSNRISFRLSDPASDHILFLGTHEYERSMYELDDTIIVDTSAMSRTRGHRPLGAKRIRLDKRKGKKRETKDDTTTEEGGDNETATDEEAGRSAEKQRITSSRKRRRAAADEGYITEEEDDGDNEDYTVSEDMDVSVVTKTSRSSPKKRVSKTRPPAMGQFNVSNKSCLVNPRLNSKSKEPEASNTPLSKEEIAEAARARELELSMLTDKPPPNGWYAGTPTHNSQWTICVSPPKPTWYHPDWDSARRKEADEFTRKRVKDGKECLARDIEKGLYRHRKTDELLVTRRTVVWWQCHSYKGRQSWAINVALEGYDEC
ncbi:hypothetical protein BKA61DRAFT_576046 [Leptodontidium sp. MPI-SDFR-AT-0119]|nr:hypothetical protein BKA61DRAFT_576046 [Leptodontidium sp. MPI-SDFR-AT-0119]